MAAALPGMEADKKPPEDSILLKTMSSKSILDFDSFACVVGLWLVLVRLLFSRLWLGFSLSLGSRSMLAAIWLARYLSYDFD